MCASTESGSGAKRVVFIFPSKPPSIREAFWDDTGVEKTTFAIFSFIGISSSDRELEISVVNVKLLIRGQMKMLTVFLILLELATLPFVSLVYCFQYLRYQFLGLDPY